MRKAFGPFTFFWRYKNDCALMTGMFFGNENHGIMFVYSGMIK